MRGSTTGRAMALAAALLPGAIPGPADPPRWRLAPGALAEYSLFPVAVDAKSGERKRKKEKPFGVFGHRIVGGRSHRPLQPDLRDLGEILALNLPADPAGGRETILFPALADCGPVEAAGNWTPLPRDDGRPSFRVEADLRHRGPPKSDDFKRILVEGRVEGSCVLDPVLGVVAEASWDLRARTVADEGAPKDRKAAEVKESADLVLLRVRDAADPGFQESVDAAIAKGVAWLLAQPKDGAYPVYDGYPGGTDALAALALYACDEERKAGDAALARAMRFEPEKTYQDAVVMMAIDMRRTPPGEAALLRAGKIDRPIRRLTDAERAWMRKGRDTLARDLEAPGRWSYPAAHGGRLIPPKPDLSNSQYAVLGLLAAHRCGETVEDSTWLAILRAFLQVQQKDGPPVAGWFPSQRTLREVVPGASAPTVPAARARGSPYRAGEEPSGTMTCAGIASVSIARDVLLEAGGRSLPADLAAQADRGIADGFGWIHSRYTVEQAPRAGGAPSKWLHYYLYAMERAGILAEVARVNEHDWYGDGALELMLTQDPEGWWTEEPGSAPRKIADTCFALLFLKRAVTPVATK